MLAIFIGWKLFKIMYMAVLRFLKQRRTFSLSNNLYLWTAVHSTLRLKLTPIKTQGKDGICDRNLLLSVPDPSGAGAYNL